MGQSASKGINRIVSRKIPSDLKCPPIPRRSSRENNASSSTPINAPNPSEFLRGKGVAAEDARDIGQENYLRYERQQNQGRSRLDALAGSDDDVGIRKNESTAESTINKEMPADLLKFIQDVGPAKQTVDKEFTAPRLLEEENKAELEKLEIKRTSKRARMRMPLIDNTNFTVEKNTNFTVDSTSSLSSVSDDDFGLSNVELYNLLGLKEDRENENDIVAFYEKLISSRHEGQAGQADAASKAKDKAKRIERLSQAIRVLDIPALRMDLDCNILGIYPNELPDPENKTFSTMPESKVMFVLKHLARKGIT